MARDGQHRTKLYLRPRKVDIWEKYGDYFVSKW